MAHSARWVSCQGVTQGEGDGQGVSDAESSMWEEIYSFLFSSFQGQFAELFKTDTLPDDQVYVWQFLSAMAVGASGIEQQKILVTEMRYFFFIWFSFL